MKLAATFALAAVLVALPVTATGDKPVCPATGCKPPAPVFDPAGSFGPLCGDPFTFARFNNRRSEVEGVYRVKWTNQRGMARGITRTLAPGERTRTPWKRIKPGTTARIVAWQPEAKAATKTLIAALPVRWVDAIHWGIKPCP
jgi:hypothetical protein